MERKEKSKSDAKASNNDEKKSKDELNIFSVTSAIIGTVVTFITLGILNFVIETVQQDNGLVRISVPVILNQNNYVSVDIFNYSRKMLDGLIMSVPSASLSGILASGPSQLERITDSVGTNQITRIRISGIEPRFVSRLWIPLLGNSNMESVRVVNSYEKRMSVESGREIENPNRALLKKAAADAGITALIYLLAMLWTNSKFKQWEENRLQLVEDLSKIKAESRSWQEKQVFRITEIERDSSRIKLFFLTRQAALSKELGFWRDTIRKLLYSQSRGTNAAQLLIEEVTRTLKTYAADENTPQRFEKLEALAILLKQEAHLNERSAEAFKGDERSRTTDAS